MFRDRRAVPAPVRIRSPHAAHGAFTLEGALVVMNRGRIGRALDSEHAVVAGQVDTVFGWQTGQEMAGGVDGPLKDRAEGYGGRRGRSSPLGRDRGRQHGGLERARRFGERVEIRSVRTQNDDVPVEHVRAQIAGEYKRAALRVGVEGRVRTGVARLISPLLRLSDPGSEYLDALVAGIAHRQPAVRKKGDGLGAAELARSFTPSAQCLHVCTLRVEDADVMSLRVEHVDAPVIVYRDRPDVAEEVLLRAVEFADRDLRDQGGFGRPYASRHGADHGRVADGFNDDIRSRGGRAGVSFTGRKRECARYGAQQQKIASHRQPSLPTGKLKFTL